MAEIIKFPDNEKPWDGSSTQSRRWVDQQGLIRDDGHEEDYADMWVAHLGLPSRLEGELWHQWAERTAKERGVGSSALKLAEQSEQEIA